MSSISNAPLQSELDGAPLTHVHEWAEETALVLTADGRPSIDKDIASSLVTTTGTGTGLGNAIPTLRIAHATYPASTTPLPPTLGVQGGASTATTPGLELPGAFPKSAMGGSGTTGQTDIAQTAKNALGTACETTAQYGSAMYRTLQSYLREYPSTNRRYPTNSHLRSLQLASNLPPQTLIGNNSATPLPPRTHRSWRRRRCCGCRCCCAAGTAAGLHDLHDLHEHHEGTVTHAQSHTRNTGNEPLPGPGSDADAQPAGVNVPQSGGLPAAGVPDDIFTHHNGKAGTPPSKDTSTPPVSTTGMTTTPPSAPSKDTPTTQAKEKGPVTTTPPAPFTKDTSGAATSGQTPSKQSSKPAPSTVGDLDNANNTSDSGKVGGVKAKVADVKDGVGAKAAGATDAAKSALPGPGRDRELHDSSEDEGKKPGLMGKLQVKMKVLSGKLGRDKEKVEEGKKMQSPT
ncbi:hypothetical protein BD410DRAFT_842926 [Rickenella mellea]|uniref:Uncharacterized protein n=1 Tax=Rickenella mellea TaxID=50990 RepID=A0A4Y7PT14_9AGAM|nr:hypothetical protein BD410DRAFT_842926 [Rickenella mellea]